jgi:acetate kinase
VKKYIGSYFAVLNGADALIFTGGIGENAPNIRSQICDRMGALGIALDPDRNTDAAGREMRIALDSAPTQVWVIPTNEELLIARDTLRCIQGLPLP